MTDVMDAAFFDFSFLVRLSDIANQGDGFKGTQECQECFIETDKRPLALNDCAFHVIVQQFPGGATEKAKGVEE